MGIFEAEYTLIHDDFAIDVDGWILDDAIHVGFAVPIGAGFARQWAAERDVDAGKLFILEQVIDQFGQAGIRADGEFTHPVAVLIGLEEIFRKFPFEFSVFALEAFFYSSAVFDLDDNGCILKGTISFGEEIPQAAVDYHRAIDIDRGCEDFSIG